MKTIGMRSFIGKPLCLALSLFGATIAATSASATIVNIDTRANSNSFVQSLGGKLLGVGTELNLNSGDYIVTPVDVAAGGLFTAALRFGSVSAPSTGWEWNYFMSVNGGAAVKIGFGEGIPAQGGIYRSTADEAFATAPTFGFNLSSPSRVAFYWRDDNFADNRGGISIAVDAVSAVPEVGGMLTMALGAVIVYLARLRTVRSRRFL